jgi:hypothetical protein
MRAFPPSKSEHIVNTIDSQNTNECATVRTYANNSEDQIVPGPYTYEEKSHILKVLAENGGNIPTTCLDTGVPERTLSRWKRDDALGIGVLSPTRPYTPAEDSPPPPPNFFSDSPPPTDSEEEDEEDEDDESPNIYDQLVRLRDQIMDHIFAITPMLSTDDDHINSRAVALTRLLDRLLKLDDAIAERTPPGERVIRIEYKFPDGTIHDRPPWSSDPDWQNRKNRPGGFWGPRPETDEPQTSWLADYYNKQNNP